jgi:hypothetical protein
MHARELLVWFAAVAHLGGLHMASTSWSHMPAMSPATPIPQDRPYAFFVSSVNGVPLLKGAQNAALELLRSRSRKLYPQMRVIYPDTLISV